MIYSRKLLNTTLLMLFIEIVHISALQLDGNVSDYLVDLGHFLGQESHDLINEHSFYGSTI